MFCQLKWQKLLRIRPNIDRNRFYRMICFFQVCEEQKCQDEVFSLAVNYMDRFLMCCSIMKNQLQLLGTVCMLLASKLRQSKPLAGETLVYYTDHSVTKEQLWVSFWTLTFFCMSLKTIMFNSYSSMLPLSKR